MSKAVKGGTIALYLSSEIYSAYTELPEESRRELVNRLKEIAKFMIVNGNVATIACNDLKTLMPSLNKLLNQVLSSYATMTQQNRSSKSGTVHRGLEEIYEVAKTYSSLYALLLKQCSYDDYVILKHSLETKYNMKINI